MYFKKKCIGFGDFTLKFLQLCLIYFYVVCLFACLFLCLFVCFFISCNKTGLNVHSLIFRSAYHLGHWRSKVISHEGLVEVCVMRRQAVKKITEIPTFL